MIVSPEPATTVFCESYEEESCFWEVFYGFNINPYLTTCQKSCSVLEYSGSVDYSQEKGYVYQPPYKNTTYFSLVVRYNPPGTETVYEEYLIVDFYGMVGVVGGTLGLFIGFSFFNVITFLIDLVKKMYKKINNQIMAEEIISSNIIKVEENQRSTCDFQKMEYVLNQLTNYENQLKKHDKRIHAMEN